jgi:hypothetical protein
VEVSFNGGFVMDDLALFFKRFFSLPPLSC